MAGLCLGVTCRVAAAAPSTNEPVFWFPVGERLVYEVSWGIIPVGYAEAWTEWVEQDGRRLLSIKVRSKTNRVLSTLFPVDDLVESRVDPATFLPVRFIKLLSEGRYRADQVTDFDHVKRLGYWRSNLDTNKSETFQIDADTRDILSLVYWLRRPDGFSFELGRRQAFRVTTDEKLYDIFAKPDKNVTLNLSLYGDVECVKMEPEAVLEGVFVRTGRMWLWGAIDSRRLPVKASVRVPIASVHVVLKEVQGPGDDFWINDKKRNEPPPERRTDEVEF